MRDSLTAVEQRRISTLLAAVTTRTLLRSLSNLCRMSGDARLIIAELVDRLPPDDPRAEPPGPS